MTILRIGPVLAAAMIATAGCKRAAPPPMAPPPATVTVVQPVSFPVQAYFEYNGHLEAVESVEVRARVKGLLQNIHFVEGDEVVAGAPLFSIDPREYRTAVARATADQAKAAADMENWKAQIKLAEAELNRLTRTSGGAVAQSEIDKARAMVEVNMAQLAVAQATRDAATAALQTANIQMGYTEIKAPISGRISRALITKGNLVGQDQPTMLTTIVSVDPLHIYFDAPERDLIRYQQKVRPKGGAAAAVEIETANESGFPHHGVIDFQENRVEASTGTVRIRGRIPNPQIASGARLLYPGLYARVRVPIGQEEPRPIIPEEALMTGQEGRYVYVVGKDNMVDKRLVTIGTRIWQAPPPGEEGPPGWAMVNPQGGKTGPVRQSARSVVAIEKGLTANDRIIVIGLQKARPGAPVNPEVWELRPPSKDGK